MASLDDLTNEAQAVLATNEEVEAQQQEQEAVLAEVAERREQKQKEVG